MTEVHALCDSANVSGAGELRPWSRTPGTLSREVRAGVLVLARSSADPLLLVGAGWIVWHLLATPMRFDEACSAISAEFGTPVEETAIQLSALLVQLLALDLVVQIP